MGPGALKQSGKEDENVFSPMIDSGAVLDQSKRVTICSSAHMMVCSRESNQCQRHILLLLKSF